MAVRRPLGRLCVSEHGGSWSTPVTFEAQTGTTSGTWYGIVAGAGPCFPRENGGRDSREVDGTVRLGQLTRRDFGPYTPCTRSSSVSGRTTFGVRAGAGSTPDGICLGAGDEDDWGGT